MMDKQPEERDCLEAISDEKGANLLEYSLLAALIAVVCIAAVLFIGQQTSNTFSNVGGHLGTSAGILTTS